MSRINIMKDIIRPIAVAVVSVSFGALLALLLKVFLNIEISKLITTVIIFIFAAFSALYLFPRVIRIPFQDVALTEFLHRLGFYLPHNTWKHILLGALLAVCTLSGMLIGSLLTGRYVLDWNPITLSHTIFSLNPGIWEEYFYRGVIMFLLLIATRSFRRAALIQVVLFAFTHIKGFDLWSWIDMISVMFLAIAFTYAAYKTRTLVAGIIFHFLHDALLFLPQVPGGEYIGVFENIIFYSSLWLMVGVACVLIKIFADRLGVRADKELYTLENLPSGIEGDELSYERLTPVS